jgi:hypothetical protein
MAIRFPRYTAGRRQKTLVQAEKEFAKGKLKRGNKKHVSIRTSEIKERLELFQPREFSHGARIVDPEWVKELARRIGIHGELDPVLVIRIGSEWVCVDGHHRIAAYRQRSHKKPIKCEWFGGTPTQAVDESMRRNKKDTLPIQSADRREEAWRRVLLGQGSKKEISQACGVSLGTVANMRKAKRRFESDPEFAARVGRPLLETSWGVMLLADRDAKEDAGNLDARSERLARTIRGRLSDLLIRDPVVTAHALAKYHKHLPRTLMDVWNERMVVSPGRPLTEPQMRRQVEVLRKRADSIEALLAKAKQERPKKLAELEKKQEEKRRQDRRLSSGPPEFDPTEDAEPLDF